MIRTDLSPEDRDVLERLIGRLGAGPIRGAEVGVARGETSAWLLKTFPNLHLTMVDAWAEYPEGHPYRESGDGCAKLSADAQERNYLTAMALTAFAADRRTVLKGDSVEAAGRIERLSLDFALIDGDHTYAGVIRDLAAWCPRLRANGLFCGHDIDHPRDKRGIWGVRLAVEAFATRERFLTGTPWNLKVGPGTNIWWFEPFG